MSNDIVNLHYYGDDDPSGEIPRIMTKTPRHQLTQIQRMYPMTSFRVLFIWSTEY